MTRISINEFLELRENYPVLDVRSPGEYAQAHIPHAHSLPLFTDEERAAIGTAYKQQSREMAIRIGLDAFGPNMRSMAETAAAIAKSKNTNKVLVHCWRGGMRSEAVCWLLNFYGLEASLLEGGYKSYRHWAIDHWNKAGKFRIVGGNTGAGKTEILHELEKLREPVIDLEGLAGHRGSAFGGLGKDPQPRQEQFENLLAEKIDQLHKKFGDKPIWIEDESQRIGDLNIPAELFQSWKDSPIVMIDMDFEKRLDHIVDEYGKYPSEQLINTIVRIKKRLGPLETKTAIGHLIEGDTRASFSVLLQYYDKKYFSEKSEKKIVAAGNSNAAEIAAQIQHYFS